MAREKMIGAFDEDEPLWFGQSSDERFEALAGAKRIVATLNEQLWLRALAEAGNLEAIDRKAERNEARYAIIFASDAEAHPRPKTEPSQKDRFFVVFRGKVVKGRADVVPLAPAPVVLTLTETGASKVESQHGCAALMKRPGHLIDDLVVHCAAEQRMRMADDRDEGRIGYRSGPEKCFQTSGGSFEEEASVQHGSHGHPALADLFGQPT
jgi:hypothetical protein